MTKKIDDFSRDELLSELRSRAAENKSFTVIYENTRPTSLFSGNSDLKNYKSSEIAKTIRAKEKAIYNVGSYPKFRENVS